MGKENVITTKTICNGLITFSFHIESLHEIRCYLYMNGAITRFHPKDAINIFSELFDNNQCIQSKEFVEMIERFETNVVDKRFDAFYDAMSPNLDRQTSLNKNDLDLNEPETQTCAFPNALKDGYLLKEERKYYFVLDNNGNLTYYQHKYSLKPLDTINMKQCIKFQSFDELGIKIFTKLRVWRITCYTEKERNEWLEQFGILKD